MPRTFCRSCAQDCVNGDIFFACNECEYVCENCAEAESDRCDYCDELVCPRCIDVTGEECKPWPSEELCEYSDGNYAGGYVIEYDCCGEMVYDGDDELRQYDPVCPSCWGLLESKAMELYPKARKEHHDTIFWCAKCDYDGCANDLCGCKKKHKVMLRRMKNTGPSKVVDGKTWHW